MKQSTKKVMIETEQGRNFTVDAHEVIHDRSKYYDEKDPDTTYEDEYNFLNEDDDEVTDWMQNNMNWWDMWTLKEVTNNQVDLSDLDVSDTHVFSEIEEE